MKYNDSRIHIDTPSASAGERYADFSSNARPPQAAMKIGVSAKRRVLVMDDDHLLGMVVHSMLEASGYEASLVADGAEAIRRYKEAKKLGCPFDIVIMDLTIPNGMGGKETIRRLLEMDPHIKAIVSSGNCDDPAMTNFRDYGFANLLPKPYSVRELSQVLRSVIGGEPEMEKPEYRTDAEFPQYSPL